MEAEKNSWLKKKIASYEQGSKMTSSKKFCKTQANSLPHAEVLVGKGTKLEAKFGL